MLADNLILYTIGTYIKDIELHTKVENFFLSKGFNPSSVIPYAWIVEKTQMKKLQVNEIINVLENNKGLKFIWEHNGTHLTLVQK